MVTGARVGRTLLSDAFDFGLGLLIARPDRDFGARKSKSKTSDKSVRPTRDLVPSFCHGLPLDPLALRLHHHCRQERRGPRPLHLLRIPQTPRQTSYSPPPPPAP